MNIILVTGGVRSGKSAFAEAYARRLEERRRADGVGVVYVATARVWDDETADRVARHRVTRPALWPTVEAPLDVAGTIALPPASDAPVVLVDSVDFWVSNRLLGADPVAGEQVDRARLEALETSLLHDVDEIVRVGRSRPGALLLVTLEAGLGVVPPTPLGRAFRDLLGRVNARLAQSASAVYLLVAGLPIDVTRLSGETMARLERDLPGDVTGASDA